MPVQHEQPPPWDDPSRGPVASLAEKPFDDDPPDRRGAVSMTRGELAVQDGQFDGRSDSAIGRMSVNGPQSLQRYS